MWIDLENLGGDTQQAGGYQAWGQEEDGTNDEDSVLLNRLRGLKAGHKGECIERADKRAAIPQRTFPDLQNRDTIFQGL